MPYSVVADHPECPAETPWACVKDDDGTIMGCHPTEEDAMAQVAALYAEEGDATDGGDVVTPDGTEGLAVERDEHERGLTLVLAVEGVRTGDRRIIEPDALTWRDLPLPLNWLEEDSHGGPTGASFTVGRIDAIERDGTTIRARAVIDTRMPHGADVFRAVDRKHLRGVSVDLDDLTGRLEEEQDGPVEVLERGRIMGATIVAFPAFPEATIELDPVEPSPDDVARAMVEAMMTRVPAGVRAMFAQEPDAGPEVADEPAEAVQAPTGAVLALLAAGDEPVIGADDGQTWHVTLAYVGDAASLSADEQDAMRSVAAQIAEQVGGPITANVSGWGMLGKDEAAVVFVEAPQIATARLVAEADEVVGRLLAGPDQHPHFVPHTTIGYGVDPQTLATDRPAEIEYDRVAALIGGDATIIPLGTLQATEVDEAIVAAIPAHPPAAWFADPQFAAPTPIQVTDDGRVFGHVAAWDTCHRGHADRCVTPPRSPTGYANFLLGATRTAEGETIPTGSITLHGYHADLSLDHRAARRHYEDTTCAVADVNVGEDQFGIWCAGALRPGVTPEQVRALRAAPPSGDWRPIGGRLDMIAVHGVNRPGFPVPRFRVEGGERKALVAGIGMVTGGAVESRRPVRDVVIDLLASDRARARVMALQVERLVERIRGGV